jgi:pyridoxamine 5'-phosphate oxidase
MRNDNINNELSEDRVHPDPILQFSEWMDDALNAGIKEPEAMSLATVSASGKPSIRMVLLKGYGKSGFIFYTNYQSRKGTEIGENSSVALVLHWKELERQVRIEGIAEKLPDFESDRYFESRPLGSQLSAIISPQSQVISGRDFLEKEREKYLKKIKGKNKRPEYWGGYIVIPAVIEFWQARPNRLHDRIRFTRIGGHWLTERLAP